MIMTEYKKTTSKNPTALKTNVIENDFVPIKKLAAYSICFYAIWAIYEFLVRPLVDGIGNEIISTLIKDGLIKCSIWVIPSLILIHKNEPQLKYSLKDMFTLRKSDLKYFLILPLFAAYIVFGLVVHGNRLAISNSFGLSDIIVVLFVGITEELVFRGWLLNATLKRNADTAMIINALMFLTIHFPIWIYEGSFILNFTSLGFVCIIMLSFVFAYVFDKTGSIIIPVILHMFWDLMMFMLY